MSRYRITQIGPRQFRAKYRRSWWRPWVVIAAPQPKNPHLAYDTFSDLEEAKAAVRWHTAAMQIKLPAFVEEIRMEGEPGDGIWSPPAPPPTGGSSIVRPK